MPAIKEKATEAIARSRDTAMRAGKVARSAAIKAAKAGAEAAVIAGSTELKKGWAESDPVVAKKSRRKKIVAVVAGAAALAAVGVAVSRSRTNGKASLNGKAGASTARLKKVVAKARKKVAAR